jgi:glucokinase|tara:strand:+ start:6044 stop:6991 length:948 start_codon:yes stop_codon:yes gene_type:complete
MSEPLHIVADIGGTNARFACLESGADTLLGIEVFPCAEFAFLADALGTYIERRHVENVGRICLAVAGPVEADWIDLPNNHWAFSQRELARSLAAPVNVINDFSAQMLSIDGLDDSDLDWLSDARPATDGGIRTVVGPGTGLGVSAMNVSGEILPSEGGHVGFAPVDEHEMELLRVLRQRYQRVSAERVLSGPGLANLYWANTVLDGNERELPAAAVTAGAKAGDQYCLSAVHDFYNILAAYTGDVALMMGATSGVYLSGGILPRIPEFLDKDRFRQRFEDKGRFSSFNAGIPLAIIRAEHPGLKGCAQALRRMGI